MSGVTSLAFPVFSIHALIAIEPSVVAGREERLPPNPPTGVLAIDTI